MKKISSEFESSKTKNVLPHTPERRLTYPLKPPMNSLESKRLERAKFFGNTAMTLVTLQKQISIIQARNMKEIVRILRAKSAHLLYLCGDDLVWYMAGQWYRAQARLGVVGRCVRTGDLQNVSSASEDPDFHQSVDTMNGAHTDTMLCFPLRVSKGGSLMGVIRVLNKIDDEFNVSDESLMQTIVMKSATELESIYSELVNLNSSISTFAAPILPTDGAPKEGTFRLKAIPANPRRRSGGAAISANSSSALNMMRIQRSKSVACGVSTVCAPNRRDITRSRSVGSQFSTDQDDEDLCITLPSLSADDDELLLCAMGSREEDEVEGGGASFIARSVSLDSALSSRKGGFQARHIDLLPKSLSPSKKSTDEKRFGSLLSKLFVVESAADSNGEISRSEISPKSISTIVKSAPSSFLPQSFLRMREKRKSATTGSAKILPTP